MSSLAPAVLQESTVVLTGKLHDGTEVVQEVKMRHQAGTPDPALMSKALEMMRGAGGLMHDGEAGTILFYPILSVQSIRVEVKRISLVTT
jgi:hypothetical protein